MTQSNWDDLRTRTLSGVAMAAVGLTGLAVGGVWFQMLVVFATAVMMWELWMMIAPDRATIGMLLAAFVASLLSGIFTVEKTAIAVLFLVPSLLGMILLKTERITFAIYALLILLCGWGLVEFRNTHGFIWVMWLIAVVVVTDIAGYFAGRTFGGPKFWPSLSPKKTWSGTIAGWAAAAAIGGGFALLTSGGVVLIVMSAVVSFASQMGDMGESALKRRMGVKDSSALIPGHGGLFDRFDGVLGATLAMLILTTCMDVPQVAW
ncbi:MAG: phosphatidate cytidylyltransferase [Pseudomonadota bacterium]